jgi:hypothetical protein
MRRISLFSLRERECAFIICCASIETPSNICYIDNRASRNMKGVRENFTDLRDPYIKMDIALGYDTIVKVDGHDTMTF